MKEEVFKKNTDKGEFYFYKKLEKKIKTGDLLERKYPTSTRKNIMEKINEMV